MSGARLASGALLLARRPPAAVHLVALADELRGVERARAVALEALAADLAWGARMVGSAEPIMALAGQATVDVVVDHLRSFSVEFGLALVEQRVRNFAAALDGAR